MGRIARWIGIIRPDRNRPSITRITLDLLRANAYEAIVATTVDNSTAPTVMITEFTKYCAMLPSVQAVR